MEQDPGGLVLIVLGVLRILEVNCLQVAVRKKSSAPRKKFEREWAHSTRSTVDAMLESGKLDYYLRWMEGWLWLECYPVGFES